MSPGQMALQRMPSRPYWTAVARVMPSTPPLAAQYAARMPSPTRPRMEAMLTIEPPPAGRITRTACLQPKNTPFRLTARIRSSCSSVVSASSCSICTAALFTITCRRPCRSTARATSASTSASRETSACRYSPIPDIVAAPAASSTSHPSTKAPSAANSRAIAWPRPEPTPVTTALRPSSGRDLSVAMPFHLLGILVPSNLVADARAQLPLGALRLVLHGGLDRGQPLRDQVALGVAERGVAQPLAQLVEVQLQRPVEPPVAGAEARHPGRVDGPVVGRTDLQRQQQRVGIVSVLLVQPHDLELRQQQVGGGQGQRHDVQPLGDRQRVAHLEGAYEHVQLALVRLVVEQQPASAVHAVEHLVGLVALLGQALRQLAAVTRVGDQVDVVVLARKLGRIGGRGHQPDPEAAQQSHRNALGLEHVRQPPALLDHVRQDTGAVDAHADPRMRSSTGSITWRRLIATPSRWSISSCAASQPIS